MRAQEIADADQAAGACSVQHGRGERLQRSAVSALRFVGALLARPALRSNAVALRTFLPPLLRPILDLLPGSGSDPSLCSTAMLSSTAPPVKAALKCAVRSTSGPAP